MASYSANIEQIELSLSFYSQCYHLTPDVRRAKLKSLNVLLMMNEETELERLVTTFGCNWRTIEEELLG